jgi:hypothetical protein
VASERRIVLHRPVIVAVAAVGLGYAVLGSFTRPFTWAADVVIALPLLAAAAVTAAATWRQGRSGSPTGPGAGTGRRSRWGGRDMIWLAPILAVVGWELYSFVSLPRSVHPTLSSLLDTFDSTHLGKTVALALWLVLGWFVVTS